MLTLIVHVRPHVPLHRLFCLLSASRAAHAFHLELLQAGPLSRHSTRTYMRVRQWRSRLSTGMVFCHVYARLSSFLVRAPSFEPHIEKAYSSSLTLLSAPTDLSIARRESNRPTSVPTRNGIFLDASASAFKLSLGRATLLRTKIPGRIGFLLHSTCDCAAVSSLPIGE
jgi:hypothetical protein